MLNKKILLSTLTSALITGSSLSLAQYDYPADPVVTNSTAAEKAQINGAIVTKIDSKNRAVTLKSKDGEIEMIAGPSVKNLNQIKVDDHINVSYQIPSATELIKVKIDAAKSKPNATQLNSVKTTASLVSIDQKKKIVTIKDPQGNLLNVKVENLSLLKGININDSVSVTHTQALAFEMKPAKK